MVKIKQTHWALFFSFLSLFILGLADNIRGPLFPEILNQFNLNNSEGSWVFALTSTFAFCGASFSSSLLKRMPISRLLLLAIFLMGSGLVVIGYSPSFRVLLSGSVLLGLSIGFMGVAQNLLVSENVPEHMRSRALSGLHGMYGLSSFLAPVIASSATAWQGSWRGAFYISGLIALVFFLLPILIKADPGFKVQSHEDQEQTKLNPSKFALFTFGGMFAFYVVAEIMVATRLALYMRTYFQMNLSESSFYVTLFFLFLLIGRVLFAFIKPNVPLKVQLNSSLIISILLLVVGLKFHPLFLALLGLGMAPFYPLSVSYISEISKDLSRKFIAFAMSFQSLAVVSMHLSVGYITDQLGLASAFGIGLMALCLSLLFLNIHPKNIYKVSSQ